MDFRRTTAGVLAISVFALLWNGWVHLFVLKEADLALLSFGRPPAERSLMLGLAITVLLALVFVVTFQKCSGGGIRAGLRHGLLFGLLAGLLVDGNQYLLYPLPLSLALAWFGFGLVEFCGYGIIVGLLFPNERSNDGRTPS